MNDSIKNIKFQWKISLSVNWKHTEKSRSTKIDMRELLNTTDNKLLYLNNKLNIKEDVEFFCHNSIVQDFNEHTRTTMW